MPGNLRTSERSTQMKFPGTYLFVNRAASAQSGRFCCTSSRERSDACRWRRRRAS